MKNSIVSTVISIILVVVMLVIAPMYYIGIIQWARAESQTTAEVRNLIDEVIDTRVLTEDMLADFNLSLSALSQYQRATITREIKVVNPDPASPGRTYTTYVVSDNISSWNQGDLITVRVETIGVSFFRSLASSMLGLSLSDDDIQMTGRVR